MLQWVNDWKEIKKKPIVEPEPAERVDPREPALVGRDVGGSGEGGAVGGSPHGLRAVVGSVRRVAEVVGEELEGDEAGHDGGPEAVVAGALPGQRLAVDVLARAAGRGLRRLLGERRRSWRDTVIQTLDLIIWTMIKM